MGIPDPEVLDVMLQAAQRAGEVLLGQYDEGRRPRSRADMYEVGRRVEAASADAVRAVLDTALPTVGWFDEDANGRSVPGGQWWIVDGAEGAVNHVHGLPEWAVSITLVTDGQPEATVVRQPIGDLTYTAVREGGAFRNGCQLRVSSKTELAAAIIAASQAGNAAEVASRFGAALAAVFDRALLVRNTIPTTFPILALAGGHYDGFWQYEPDLPGTAAGSLIAAEAGAVVTDVNGDEWSLDSDDIVIAAPGIHAAMPGVLSSAVAA